jgi:AraC family transcriptional regulator
MLGDYRVESCTFRQDKRTPYNAFRHMKIGKDPRYEIISETHLVGKCARMSIAKDNTLSLWQEFMPDYPHIPNRAGSDFYAVEVYDSLEYFRDFDPSRPFDKWAAVAVSETDSVPKGMELLILPAGRYAVFHYRGRSSEVHKAYQYIYGTWIGKSGHAIDHRPHFAVMGAGYKGEHPDSEEEIWIPVKP